MFVFKKLCVVQYLLVLDPRLRQALGPILSRLRRKLLSKSRVDFIHMLTTRVD